VILRPPLPMLRMWQFNHAARLKLKDLGTEVNLGFGRTTAHDFHRAGRRLPRALLQAAALVEALVAQEPAGTGAGTESFTTVDGPGSSS